jgi:hypothetical protein
VVGGGGWLVGWEPFKEAGYVPGWGGDAWWWGWLGDWWDLGSPVDGGGGYLGVAAVPLDAAIEFLFDDMSSGSYLGGFSASLF